MEEPSTGEFDGVLVSLVHHAIVFNSPRKQTFFYSFARFEPIVIPAGTKKGIYITVNETVAGVNLIGMDKKELTTCQTESAEPFDFPIWFENNDIAVYEGTYWPHNNMPEYHV